MSKEENRIIYYYQTFTGLEPILEKPCIVTHIHLSSIHFGSNSDNSPYIHLNDHSPNDPKFDQVWTDINKAHQSGIKIILMVGGAGGAFGDLFRDFDTYYSMLYDTIKSNPCIEGIDLDVEESTSLDSIKMLIDRLDKDFGKDFIIAMAPLGDSLMSDYSGMGGFVYKDLYKSPQGQRINYFNGQFYGNYNLDSYIKAVENGYPANKVVIGMVSGDFTGAHFADALATVKSIKNKYGDFGGVFAWEYFDSPPGSPKNSGLWAQDMYKTIHPYTNYNLAKFMINGLGRLYRYITNYTKT